MTGLAAYAYLGLASGEVYMAPVVSYRTVRSYRTFPPLPPHLLVANAKAVYFCCTVSGVASAGRYPAPLPRDARTFLTAAANAATA